MIYIYMCVGIYRYIPQHIYIIYIYMYLHRYSLWKLTKLKKLATLASSPVQPATQRSVCSQPAIKFDMALYHRVSYHHLIHLIQIYTISEYVLMYLVLDATAFARLSTPEWPPSNCSDIVWTKLGHSRRVKRVASCHVV